MSHYFKTELGQTALKQRNITLTARQRRLLLLIDHEDFHELNQNHKEKLAPTELIHQLIEMGLLAEQVTSPGPVNEIQIKLNEENNTSEKLSHSAPLVDVRNAMSEPIASPQAIEIIDSEAVNLEKLAFVEIQQLMIQTLSNYCGLMARPLIQQIQKVKTLPELKACQMQWITSLQESRITPTQLNQTLRLINYSVEHL
nr:hypothetical protein [Acinetobacter haemolyticus]